MQTNPLIQPNRPRKMTPHQDDWGNSMGGFVTTATQPTTRPQWQPESEIAQLQTEVFAATGIKVSEDDPILAVLVVQKRNMQAYAEQLQQQQSEQQEVFLAQFQIQAQAVI